MMHQACWRAAAVGVALVACCGTARADRAGVEASMAAMAAAAQSANVEEYLSYVVRTDPIFLKEQENWAKDLKRKTPARVSFAVAKGSHAPTPEWGEKRARFEMVTTWSMPGTGNAEKGPERMVSFPVVFELGTGNRWLYAGEDWLTLESDGKAAAVEAAPDGEEPKDITDRKKKEDTLDVRDRDVRFQGPAAAEQASTPRAKEHRARVRYFAGYEEAAKKIVAVLPLVRDHVDEGFGGEVPRVQEVKLYPTMKHLQESIYLSYVDGLGGWNEPGEAIKLLTRPTATSRGLRTLLAHEYGHVATFELGEKANDMPWWALEGVAELSAERFTVLGKDAESAVIGWHNGNGLAKWEDLADFHKVQEDSPRDLQWKVYKQGQHMLMYISDRWGKEGRNAWLRAMAQGKTIEEASQAALKMEWSAVDEAWRARVKELADAAAAKREAEKKEADAKEPQAKQ